MRRARSTAMNAATSSAPPRASRPLREHRRSFEAGNGAHLALLERHPDRIGANLNTFEENDTLYTVLGFTGGRSLEQEYALAATDLRLLCTRMLSLLDA